MLRLAAGRAEEPTAAIIDSRTLLSTLESGARAGYDGAKRKRGSKLSRAGQRPLLALPATFAITTRGSPQYVDSSRRSNGSNAQIADIGVEGERSARD